ncbi:DMT family transporter [Tistrella mobilis]
MTTAARAEGPRTDLAARASMLLVTVVWGLNWPAGRLALQDLSPWALRVVSFGCAAAVLMAVARRRGVSLQIEGRRQRLDLAIAGLLNTGGFGILAAFAQLGTSTSRTAICAYTMPIWATALACLFLGERLDRRRIAALVLGIAGLAVLMQPLMAEGLPLGVVFALGSAVSWAAGTVWLKRAGIQGHPIAIAAWQLVAGTVAVTIGFLLDGAETGDGVHLLPALGLAYNTLIGSALAYLLWFQAVARLPASVAGLGTLLVPAVGVVASVLLLGERPDATDLAGFALISLAALAALAPATLFSRFRSRP